MNCVTKGNLTVQVARMAIMHNLQVYEECFQKYLKTMPIWAPDTLIHVDLELLQHHDLLDFGKKPSVDAGLTRYFQVFETFDKITLINDEFVIWIVPEQGEEASMTYVMVALNSPSEGAHLETAFVTSGIYNTSHLVLRILEKFLQEIQENEELLRRLRSAS